VRGLLVDFGGVLTTNVFDSFKAFCRAVGLPEDAVKSIFRERGEGLVIGGPDRGTRDRIGTGHLAEPAAHSRVRSSS